MFLCLTWTIKGRSAPPFVTLPNRLFVFSTQSTAVTECVKHRWTPKFLKSILQDRSSKLENGDAIYRQLERNFNVDIFKWLLITRVLFCPFLRHFAVFGPSFPRPLSRRPGKEQQQTTGKPPETSPPYFRFLYLLLCLPNFKANFWIRGTILNSR